MNNKELEERIIKLEEKNKESLFLDNIIEWIKIAVALSIFVLLWRIAI